MLPRRPSPWHRLCIGKRVIQLCLTLAARPGQTDAMVRALNSVMLWARLDRAGARCQLWTKVDEPESLCYIEEWPTVEDLERQMCEEAFTRLLAVMEAAAEPPVLEFRFVSETRGLDYVAVVRGRMPAPGAL